MQTVIFHDFSIIKYDETIFQAMRE